jgi:hypothetical protein
MMKHLILLSAALLMALAPASYAATAKVKGFITKTVVADEGRWGGCMVSIDQRLADSGLDCPGKWVSFSCSGLFTEKDVAYRMFDQAQMAFTLGRKVEIYVDDTKKHNGYCYGNRINVLK